MLSTAPPPTLSTRPFCLARRLLALHSQHTCISKTALGFLPVLTSLLLSAAVTSSLSPGGSDRHDSAVGPHTRIPTRSQRVGHCACGRQPPLLIKPQILEVRSAPLSALRIRLRSSADLIRFGQPVSFPLQSICYRPPPSYYAGSGGRRRQARRRHYMMLATDILHGLLSVRRS